jgi:hypothetical protein
LIALMKHLRYRELGQQGLVGEGDRDAEPVQSHNQHSDES